MKRFLLRRLAASYLIVQALGVAAWWLMLWRVPDSRSAFFAAQTPESVIFAFCLPDLIIFIGAGILAALALWRNSPRAFGLLLWHCGGAMYAALFCLSQAWQAPETTPAALAMSPCLMVPSFLAWRLRPR